MQNKKMKNEDKTDNYKIYNKQSFLGMRIVKTVISIYLSIIITSSLGGMPINSAIAALLSTQDTHKGSREYGKNRIIGTFIGAIFAVIFVFFVDIFEIKLFTPIYYLCMSLLLIPIIKLSVFLKMSGTASSACIVFLISLMSYVEQSDLKYAYVFHRVIDTFIGVVIAVIINDCLPDNRENVK